MRKNVSILQVNVLPSNFCENNCIVYIGGIYLYQDGVHLLDAGREI